MVPALLCCGDEPRIGRRSAVTVGHARCRRDLHDHPVAELLSHAQRLDAVAGARALSDSQELLRAELRPGWTDHPGLSVHGLHAATFRRPLHRPTPAAVFADGRHRPHPRRPALDVSGRDVSRDPGRGHVDRDGLGHLPARGLTRGSHGRRRTVWACPILVPGGRKHWLGVGPVARRIRRRPPRPVEHRVVLCFGADRHLHLAAGLDLLRPTHHVLSSPAPHLPRPREDALAPATAPRKSKLPRRKVIQAVAILVALLFSKNVYSASLSSYYTFYLIDKFHLSIQTAQFYLVAFLVGIVAGTIAGGAVGDRVGRKPVMWFSILGALPFALLLPYADLFWTGILAVLIAMIMASA